MKALKEDIVQAKENEFGRKVFEAFSGEFMASQLNEGTEVAKVNKKLNESANKVAELEKVIADKDADIEGSKKTQRILEDKMNRKEVLSGLLAPLGKEKATVMSDLLESVKTSNLQTAFKKYLPAVLDEKNVSTKETKTLTEGKVTERTGDRGVATHVEPQSSGSDAEIIQLKKLAGLN